MDFSKLTPGQFENLTFDLLQAAGLRQLVWRTPGSDGGRDIEGVFSSLDFSEFHHLQKWYVECKRYATSIDWPTVWRKVSYADNRGADYLLLVTNSTPSPVCETEIAHWNATNRRLIVRVWRGYELTRIVSTYPAVAAKYGLLGDDATASLSLQGLMETAMKLAQASYVAHEMGLDASRPLEANAGLAELISDRQAQLKQHGKITPLATAGIDLNYSWLSWAGPTTNWEDVALRSLLTIVRHLFGASKVVASSTDRTVKLTLEGSRLAPAAAVNKTLKEVAVWADVEIVEVTDVSVTISSRIYC